MAISRSLMQNLIDDRELVISPYNAGSFISNHYELHVNKTITVYDQKFNENTVMDANALPSATSVSLTSKGYALEPGRQYNITLKETVKCDLYTCQIFPNSNLSRYGMSISLVNDSALGNGAQIIAAVTVNTAIVIYPDMAIADLYLNEGDTGLGSIPIGGIIGWGGGAIPYGYCLCDGSNGSPNLVGRFIKGGNTNRPINNVVLKDIGSEIYELVFIMRYK